MEHQRQLEGVKLLSWERNQSFLRGRWLAQRRQFPSSIGSLRPQQLCLSSRQPQALCARKLSQPGCQAEIPQTGYLGLTPRPPGYPTASCGTERWFWPMASRYKPWTLQALSLRGILGCRILPCILGPVIAAGIWKSKVAESWEVLCTWFARNCSSFLRSRQTNRHKGLDLCSTKMAVLIVS